MIFKIDKDPNDTGRVMFLSDEIEIKPGITCIVGCNGSGKTTLMDHIRHHLTRVRHAKDVGEINPFKGIFGVKDEETDELVFAFDKNEEYATSEQDGIMGRLCRYMESTGEGIISRLGHGMPLLGKAFGDKRNEGKKAYLFLDDLDAGTSIDMIAEIKETLGFIAQNAKEHGIECHIIVSANSYEMCRGVRCVDANTFEEWKFDDYEGYRKLVLDSKKRKETAIIQAEKRIIKSERKRKPKERKHE